MAGEGYKLFVDDEVLFANDVNGYLMDQSVMVFNNPAERDAEIISVSEGMVAYTKSDDLIRYYNGTSWIPIAVSVISAGSGLVGGGAGTSSVTLSVDVDAKGDLLVGTAPDTVAKVGVGANNSVLVADSAQTAGVRWATTLTGLTLTAPVISTISNTGTITVPTATTTLVGTNTTDTLTNKTLTSPIINTPSLTGGTISTAAITNAVLAAPFETWQINTGGATGTVTINTLTSSVVYYTGNSSGAVTINVQGDGSTSLASLMTTGRTISVALLMTNGATAYYPTQFRIDNVVVTPLWQGIAPTSGNANSTDVWLYTIVRTSTGYKVLGSVTQFV